MKHFTKKRTIYGAALAAVLLISLAATSNRIGSKAIAENNQTRHTVKTITGYVLSLDNHTGVSITLDEIQWYQSEEANRIFAEREPEAAAEIGGPLNDYYIVNDEEIPVTYPVSDHAEVLMQLYGNQDIRWNESISLTKLVSLFGDNEGVSVQSFPYHVTLEDGVITKIVQQYVP